MIRQIALLVVVGLLIGILPGTTHAYVQSADRLISSEIKNKAWDNSDFSDPANTPGLGWVIYKYEDILPLLEGEMIRDEAWLDLIQYERDYRTILPLISAQLFMTYQLRTKVKRTSQPTGERTRMRGKVEGPGIPLLLRLLFPGVAGGKVGLLEVDRSKPVSGKWGLLSFIFEQEGILSGEEWNWENFLPRLLSVVALVVLGLLLIEFMRFVVLIGMRALGKTSRRM